MPEIAEVARVVHFLRKSLVGKTLAVVKAQDDASVFGKVGTTGAEVQKALVGKKVIDAGSQGKYFWLIMSSPPHPVFHFGMTGWFYIRGEKTIHYRPKNPREVEEWPPKYWKLMLETDEKPKVEAAYADSRRFGRIRLVDCAGEDIRKTTPLKENGPDPVIDKNILTAEWLEKKLRSKHVPIKALLLDQANISGVGNWVGDEVLYNAKLHPEQYSNTFSSDQIKQLHKSLLYVCQTAVDLLGDSSKFPEDWLFNHRWGKGKKDAPTTMPNGAKIIHLTVGGRTSCVVPSVQKKTGAVAGDVKKEENEELETGDEVEVPEAKKETKAKGLASRKRKTVTGESEQEVDHQKDGTVTMSSNSKKIRTDSKVNLETQMKKAAFKEEVTEEGKIEPRQNETKGNSRARTTRNTMTVEEDAKPRPEGRRRSGRKF
ncbi:putative formamidopyrimidine-DNA glycosylase [Tricladium varicosporioides]|nr:putative formamidopyrimidine-DNA glycosylase [Hymenoscyphus varicosporioides]